MVIMSYIENGIFEAKLTFELLTVRGGGYP